MECEFYSRLAKLSVKQDNMNMNSPNSFLGVTSSKRLWERFSFSIGRFIRFGMVGIVGVFVDMTLLYLLSDPSKLGWSLTCSKIIAAELAIINNFLWNDSWTFADLAREQWGWHQRGKRFLKFNLVCLLGLGLNLLVLNVVFNFVFPNRYAANLIGIVATSVWNFWINLKLNWQEIQVNISTARS